MGCAPERFLLVREDRAEDIEPTLESLHESAAYPALMGNEVNCEDTVN